MRLVFRFPVTILLLGVCAISVQGSRTDRLPVLHLDKRYVRSIRFDQIGITIPIVRKSRYLRSDGFVDRVQGHEKVLVRELGIPDQKFDFNWQPGNYGGYIMQDFCGGEQVAFIWSQKDSDEMYERSGLEHEKYHALVGLNPEGISTLSAAIRKKGFDIELSNMDEELGCEVVESLSLCLQGFGLEYLCGSGLSGEADDVLRQSQVVKPPMPHINERYKRTVDFDMLGISVPITKPDRYIYSYGLVFDMDDYIRQLYPEVGMPLSSATPKEQLSRTGLGARFIFKGGGRCVYICSSTEDENTLNARLWLELEKYHALAWLDPSGVRKLWSTLKKKGYDVDFNSLDESTAARVVFILSLHYQTKVPLYSISSGDDGFMKAIRVVKRAAIKNH